MLKATLEQWRMFKAVVEAGGFNQAAVEGHKSQSRVHHAVQKIKLKCPVTSIKTYSSVHCHLR